VVKFVVENEYFLRVWIAQEIVLGRTNVCQIGDTLFSTAVFAAAFHVLCTMPERLNAYTICKDGIVDFRIESILNNALDPALRNRWPSSGGDASSHDMDVITGLNSRRCLNPRDKIYGVASLFEYPDTYAIDYTLSIAEVFADFTAHCVRDCSIIAVLNDSLRVLDRTSIYTPWGSEMPSWCPDWAVDTPGIDHKTSEQAAYCDWQASGNHGLCVSRPSKVTLSLKGLVIDRVQAYSSSRLYLVDQGRAGSKLTWWDNAETLCTFFDGQSFRLSRLDDCVRDLVLRL
jgi:hypothetical protein